MASNPHQRVIVGEVVGLYGVAGWVKVHSWTKPRENIVGYTPWLLQTADGWRVYELEAGRRHGKGIVAKLHGVDDRDQAAALLGQEIAIERRQLPVLAEGDYYWTDLIGLKVVNRQGVMLGVVDHLIETGANDVMVLAGERQRLLPYVPGQVVLEVDLEAGSMRVDWDPED